MAGIGKKVEGAVKRAAKGKATGGTTSSGRKGGGTGKKGKGSNVERAARELLK